MQGLTLGAELDFVIGASLGTLLEPGFSLQGEREIDWHRVVRLAKRHRVDALVFDRLKRGGARNVPPSVLLDLEEAYRAHVLKYLMQCAETVRLDDVLQSAGIPCIFLKGCTIAERYYQPSPALRYSNDIDLLVAPRSLEQADAALRNNGYERMAPEVELAAEVRSVHHLISMHYLYVHRRSQHVVELHHRLVADPAVLAFPFEELLDRSVEVELPGGRVRGLGESDGFAYGCYHGARHAFGRVKWLADAARTASALDSRQIEEAFKLATSGCCRRSFLLAAALMERFGAGQPGLDLYSRRAESLTFIPHVLAKVREEEEGGAKLGFKGLIGLCSDLMFEYRLAEGRGSKWHRVIRFLVVPSDLARFRLSRNWLGVYALLGWPLAGLRFVWRKATGQGEVA